MGLFDRLKGAAPPGPDEVVGDRPDHPVEVETAAPEPDPGPEVDQAAERRSLIELIVYAYDRARSSGVTERLTEGLAAVGVSVQQPDGEPYDPQRHEVGGVVPTADPALQDTIAETELVGFTDRGTVIREPIVVVYRHE